MSRLLLTLLALLWAAPAVADDSAPDDDDSAPADDDDSAAAPDAPSPGALEAIERTAAMPLAPTALTVTAPKFNSGLNLLLEWTPTEGGPPVTSWAVFRAPTVDGPWEVRADNLTSDTTSFDDKVSDDPLNDGVEDSYFYIVAGLGEGLRIEAETMLEGLVKPRRDASDEDGDAYQAARVELRVARGQFLLQHVRGLGPVEGRPQGSFFNTSLGFVVMFIVIGVVGFLMFWFTAQARAGKEIYIRRIPGIDAIEEGIGRATEMGKPVLYVPGIDELQDIQTIASMLILGEVSKKVAEYQSDIIVSCCIPIVREVADEVVKAGYYQAGYPDAYRSVNTRFVAATQFAFCAGTNGIILREKPATNIYLGRFFAESLILAETGFVNKSIQIAGTAEATQLPFFIAACDYTLIGEELFAVSAYLSKDPRLVSSLKASDWVKVFCVACILLGSVASSFGIDFFVQLFAATGH